MTVIYSPSDVSDLLKIKPTTLRKYCLLLEEYNYKFQKNERNQRWYSDNDIIILKKIIALKNNGAMTLEKAIESVVTWSNGNEIAPTNTDTITQQKSYKNDMEELKSMIINQNEQIQKLGETIIKMNEYMEQKLEKRDQLLIESLRENQRAKKEMAAVIEKEENKSFFQRLFNK